MTDEICMYTSIFINELYTKFYSNSQRNKKTFSKTRDIENVKI